MHFDTIWRNVEAFELPTPQPNWCPYAASFTEWAESLLETFVTRNPTVASVNQAKVLLQDKYFEWYFVVPKSHREHIGTRGHTCIYQVFVNTYLRLKQVELSLTPPLLFLPTPSPPPQIAGIFLGDLDDE